MPFTPPTTFSPGQPGFAANLNNTITALGAYIDAAGILNGAGAPASGTGSNGQFYIDTQAGLLYGPKTAGAWPASTLPFGNAAVQATALPVSPGTFHTFGAGVATGTVRTFNLGPPYLTTSREPAIQVTVQNGSSVAGIASQAFDIIPNLLTGVGTIRSPRVLSLPSCPPAQSISFQLYGAPIGTRLEIDAINDIVDPASFNVSLQAWAV
jgi:hypothetical protein